MRAVYKCDFCCETNEDKKKIIEHEFECSFNPKNKKCYTCNWQQQEGAPISGIYTGCSQKHDFEDVQDSDNPCEFWEIEE